jgi:microcystin-dependent protein
LGSPNPKSYDLVFRIFSAPSGGASLWAERQVVAVDQGQYDVMLGEGMSHGVEPWPSLDTVLSSGTGTARYLEVTVRGLGIGGSDVTLLPRLLLSSQPYAFLVRHARTAEALVDSNAIPVLRVSGTAVGIGVEQANATLDVGGVVTTTAFASEGNTTVNGRYAAASFTGGGTLPIGSIIAWTRGTPPEGWALCDGSTVQGRRTPDLRSRFVLGQGQGSGLTGRSVGQVGGAEAYTLTEANFAAHRHVFDPPGTWADRVGGHNHSYQTHSANVGWAIPEMYVATSDTDSRHLHTARTVSHGSHQHALSFSSQSHGAGGGQPHATMPPFYALSFIMRVR